MSWLPASEEIAETVADYRSGEAITCTIYGLVDEEWGTRVAIIFADALGVERLAFSADAARELARRLEARADEIEEEGVSG